MKDAKEGFDGEKYFDRRCEIQTIIHHPCLVSKTKANGIEI
jgi:hypothetical protein